MKVAKDYLTLFFPTTFTNTALVNNNNNKVY